MLTVAGSGGPINEYSYDADGRRVQRRVWENGVLQNYWQVYGLGGELLAEYNVMGGTPSLQKEHAYRNGQLLVVYDASETGNKQWQWLVTDQLGTPRMIADLSGSLTGMKRHDYLPFGEELMAGTGVRDASYGYAMDQVRQKFGTYERDTETGLDLAQARYYASVQGRFTSVDPITLTVERLVDPQRINLYTYCRNNPLAFIDPTGEYITFADDETKKRYEEYVKFLNTDTKKYANELATVKQLQNSEVEYRLLVGGNNFEGAEGNTTTDGKRINIAISNVGGPSGETFSLNSRFTHELEHGRQFDSGEFAFYKGSDGKWHPAASSYDIGDEVKAWQAQLNSSINTDFWKNEGGQRKPSLLSEFSRAKNEDERAGVLARSSYPNRNPRQNSNYVYAGNEAYKPGQLVRTDTVFTRVHSVVKRP